MTNEQETGTTLDDQWGAAFAEEQSTAKPKEAPKKEEAKPASFASLKQESNGAVTNLDMILDIPVTLSVEIGRTRMMVKDLLQLGQGAVVELEKLAGEPMEILVNGRLVARGEAVVINEKFGIKLTDIASPSERISKLR
ncbi:MAG: flagellar motor switch protein FliN [Deltaproteobacteria bacterium]|nr:flagellar motor switch protein FliN [Deltaproteobacteria bacterium]